MAAPPEGFELLIEWLKDPRNVLKMFVGAAAVAGTFMAKFLGGTANRNLLKAEKELKPTPPALPSRGVRELELEVATLKVQFERADWRAKEWEGQYGKLAAEHDKTSAELTATRQKLLRYELTEEQKLARMDAADTVEVVTSSKRLPPPRTPIRRKT